MANELLERIRREDTPDGITPSVTNSFFPVKKTPETLLVSISEDALLQTLDAQKLIGQRIVRVESTADDTTLHFESGTKLLVSIDAIKSVILKVLS